MTRRVGINLLWLIPGVVGGSEESTVASVRALAARDDPDLQLHLFATPALLAAHPDLAALPHDVLPGLGASRPARMASESTWLAARSRRMDLLHHAGGTAPPVRAVPYVLTVHDLQPLERRATHGRLKRAYLRTALPRSVARARRVVVPSEHVRRSVIARFGTDPAKVVAVPHGVATMPGAGEDDLRRRYELPGDVILYPAISYHHKNHAVLVDAFARIAPRHPDAVLVLTGGAGREAERLRAQIDAAGLTARVRRPGRVAASDVAGLYRIASVVAVPSRYEGFGLPAAEAMAYGAPVVAAAATALPEVVGDAGLLVDPDDPAAWAAALDSLLGDEEERQRLAAAGQERAARYTWAANAAALAEVYRTAR